MVAREILILFVGVRVPTDLPLYSDFLNEHFDQTISGTGPFERIALGHVGLLYNPRTKRGYYSAKAFLESAQLMFSGFSPHAVK